MGSGSAAGVLCQLSGSNLCSQFHNVMEDYKESLADITEIVLEVTKICKIIQLDQSVL